jgi:hypothetical protein
MFATKIGKKTVFTAKRCQKMPTQQYGSRWASVMQSTQKVSYFNEFNHLKALPFEC